MIKRIVYYYTLAALLIPNVMLCVTEHPGIAAALAQIILPAGIIMLILSSSSNIGRSIWLLFPLFFLDAFQFVLLELYGDSIIAVDMFLNLVTTNATEVTELLENLLFSVGLVFLIYLPPLIAGALLWYKKQTLDNSLIRRGRKIGVVACVMGAAMVAVAYMSDDNYDIKDDLYPADVIYNIYLAVDRTVKTSGYRTSSSGYEYGSTPTHDNDGRELYMMVIGETSRAANWQLTGYGRETNPRLASRGDVLACRQAMSESNTTHKSVPMLLSPVSAVDFDKNIYNVKSIISAFKEAGYHTAFISNQRYNHSFIDFFGEEADTVVFVKERPDYNPVSHAEDLILQPYVESVLSGKSMKQLIVLHTYGSHFNYLDRYEPGSGTFLPDIYPDASPGYRKELVNAYDNSILVTDRLLSACIAMMDSIPEIKGGLLYTSDHGEDIFDDNSSRFLHASPLPTIYQVHVPLIAWLTEGYKTAWPERYASLTSNMDLPVSTSRSFAPTLVQMAGIKTSRIDTTASLMSIGYQPLPSLYLNDHNEAVPLESILKK